MALFIACLLVIFSMCSVDPPFLKDDYRDLYRQ
jgi:hypothetical protein